MEKHNTFNQYLVQTLDLEFMGFPGTIAAYLIPNQQGLTLIECGPGSTLNSLKKSLIRHGYSLEDINAVLLTHIHLDHAGSAGALSKLGADIYVHHVGAPHLLKPAKLLSSAARIYGDMMEELWGETLPVVPDRLNSLRDGQIIEIGGLRFRAIDTPGHANHHLAYIYKDICFSGDIGGVRLYGLSHLRLPMPPPELHLGKWRGSINRLMAEDISIIAPTHFGMYSDPQSHLTTLNENLEITEQWITHTMQTQPTRDEFSIKLKHWIQKISKEDGLSRDQIEAYEIVNPSWMSSLGIYRYWQKHISKH
jgi:glyoxylase-like metal-dependent hydrolase (beta-lactamase superfamily II)